MIVFIISTKLQYFAVFKFSRTVTKYAPGSIWPAISLNTLRSRLRIRFRTTAPPTFLGMEKLTITTGCSSRNGIYLTPRHRILAECLLRANFRNISRPVTGRTFMMPVEPLIAFLLSACENAIRVCRLW